MKVNYVQQQEGQVETITMTVLQKMIALNYYTKFTNCSAVNKADWLQNVYVYNADSFKQHDAWFAMVAYTDSPNDYFGIGTAWYDDVTKRIVLDNRENPELWVCLPNVFRIVFKA